MPLTDLQDIAFNQTVDLYKPTANTVRSGTSKSMSGVYYALAYSAVRCRFGQTPAVAQGGPIGATDEYMVYTYDVLRLTSGQECDDRWYAHNIEFDQWYSIQGTAQVHHFQAQESVYKCARAEAPPMSMDLGIIGGNPG